MGYIKKVALFFQSEDFEFHQICTIPRKLSMGLAQFCLIGGPPNRRRILLWGVAIGPRRHMSIPQHFFSMACPNDHHFQKMSGSFYRTFSGNISGLVFRKIEILALLLSLDGRISLSFWIFSGVSMCC